jgi:hypothetical protein
MKQCTSLNMFKSSTKSVDLNRFLKGDAFKLSSKCYFKGAPLVMHPALPYCLHGFIFIFRFYDILSCFLYADNKLFQFNSICLYKAFTR